MTHYFWLGWTVGILTATLIMILVALFAHREKITGKGKENLMDIFTLDGEDKIKNITVPRAKPSHDNQCPNCGMDYKELGGCCSRCGLFLNVEVFEKQASLGFFDWPPEYMRNRHDSDSGK